MRETPIDRGLEGRVVLVTGGGSGIGRASAIAFAGEGARVVVSDVDSDGGEETVQLIEELGAESMFVPADVSDGEQVVRLIAATLDRYGRLDCAHNNGGIEGPLASVVDLAEDDWNRVIDINLKGIWWCLKHEIPAMLLSGGGAVVNTASVSGLKGFPPLLPAYVASKFGVVGLTAVTALLRAARYPRQRGLPRSNQHPNAGPHRGGSATSGRGDDRGKPVRTVGYARGGCGSGRLALF